MHLSIQWLKLHGETFHKHSSHFGLTADIISYVSEKTKSGLSYRWYARFFWLL